MPVGNAPIYVRNDQTLNTVSVVDGAPTAEGYGVLVRDPAAAALLQTIATHTADTSYSYAFTWSAGKLTEIDRTLAGVTQTTVLGYDAAGNLISISAWA